MVAPHPVQAGPALEPRAFLEVRRRAVLECCKWDPQVGDVGTLARWPLLVSPATWRELAGLAERLAGEMLEAEEELFRRPELHGGLGLPRGLRAALVDALRHGRTPAAARIVRFDFHWTADGWRISEVNSDVPGGYSEASGFTPLVAAHVPGARAPGDPGGLWADAVAARGPRRVALLSAPGYMEDTQVVAFMAARLRERGAEVVLAKPENLRWEGGRASLEFAGPVDAVVRFFQAEWLPELPRRSGWQHLVARGLTPVTNPGTAALTESKRFPLAWDALATPLPTWRRLLPETRDPRQAPWRRDPSWILKSALGNNGDDVAIPGETAAGECRRAGWGAWLRPGAWVAQRKFESLPVATPDGPRHACLGVYVVEGRAGGVYGRVAPRPVIDYQAVDAAVLVKGASEEVA